MNILFLDRNNKLGGLFFNQNLRLLDSLTKKFNINIMALFSFPWIDKIMGSVVICHLHLVSPFYLIYKNSNYSVMH